VICPLRVALALFLTLAVADLSSALLAEPIDIGNRREPFVDGFLIDTLTGVTHEVQQPTPREVVLTTDEPWEGNTCAYYTIFQDGDLYRMYYRGSHYDETTKKETHPEVTCYAESRDGIHWTKPNLGLFEFEGSKENNIVWNGIGTHCFTPFKDANPAARPEARYKAISRGRPQAKKGLYIFQSPDGLNWSLIQDEPVITEGAFDSQNLAFWDVFTKQYRCYHRDFRKVRDIKTQTSDDFVHWTAPEFLTYPDRPLEHLYTNAIQNDPRSPHILVGFPTRFLPDQGQRVEPTFMSSRDGKAFHRWLAPVIPESAPLDRKGNRSNYMTWGVLSLPDAPREYSVYATEAYYTGPDSRVRRFTYRVDGFVALKTRSDPGEVVTKPLKFSGKRLLLNFAAGESGLLRVELQDADGKPIPGFTLTECQPLAGDDIDGEVRWTGDGDLESLAGRTIRVRIAFIQSELYSLKFD
jgi:hypothetical protein